MAILNRMWHKLNIINICQEKHKKQGQKKTAFWFIVLISLGIYLNLSHPPAHRSLEDWDWHS